MVSSDESSQRAFAGSLEEDDFEPGGSFSSSSSAVLSRNYQKELCNEGKKRLSFLSRRKDEPKPTNSGVFRLRSLRNRSPNPLHVASVNVLKRHKKGKWKNCIAVIEDTSGPQLLVYENEKSTRPKIILDLCYCHMYTIDEKVVQHANCILIVSNGHGTCLSVYFAFLSCCDFLRWFGFLRRRCFGCRPPMSPFEVFPASATISFHSLSFVNLTVCDYRGTNLNSEYLYSSCVLINGVRITQTMFASATANNYVPFHAHFLLENIPSGPCSLQLQLVSYKRTGTQQNRKPSVSSSLFSLLDDGCELRVNAEDRGSGFVFKAVRYKVVVLPEENYASFFSLLTSQAFLLCLWTASMLNAFDLRHFARHLLTLFLPTQSVFLSFIEKVLEAQLQQETAATLFRQDTFCSSCISTALRIVGRDAVLYELSPLLQELHSEKPSDIDVEKFVSALRKLSPRLPPLLGAVLTRVAQAVRNRFPDNANCVRRALSCFFILRFVNPILTFWDAAGGPARKLAKAVQEAANQASSVNFDPRTANHTASLMSQIIDDFMKSPYEPEGSDNPFAGYSKEGHFAMVVFEVGRVLDENPHRCPIPESFAVVRSLRNYVEVPAD